MKRLGNWVVSFSKDESGGILILVGLLIVVLLGMAALAVDAGALYQSRREAVNAADAAALAGAQQLYRNLTSEEDEDVKTYAEDYATDNYNCESATALVRESDYEVEVIVENEVDLMFARFIVPDDFVNVSARAVAKIGSQKDGNILPIGISESLFYSLLENANSDDEGVDFDFIQFEDHPFESGNWGWVAFHNENAHVTVEYLEDGYDASIGDPIETNPGANIAPGQSQRMQEVEDIIKAYRDSGEELWIPVTGDMANGKKNDTIKAFAVITIDDYTLGAPTALTNISGKIWRGEFDALAISTDGDYNIFYPSGVALVE